MLFLWWVAVVSIISLGGSWYARRFGRTDALLALYVVLALVAQIAATKIMAVTIGGIVWTVPAGVVAFSVTFLLADIVNERFGRAETIRMITIALATQIVAFLVFVFALNAPAAPWWHGQDAFAFVIGSSLRIAVAGWVAFWASETIDAYLFAWFKRMSRGKHLWMRTVFSSLPSMAVDSGIFVVLAFWGVAPIWQLICGQIAAKWIIAVADVPFMYANRAVLYARGAQTNNVAQ
ncbi:MAG: queuosine precursor transporter [Candidatus Paceibacterota bacterium]|jgi:hypothetical protein